METEDSQDKKTPCDPGWNDPPMFSYECHTTQMKAEKRGNLLNKRVAFPLHPSGISGDSKLTSIDPTLPPQPCDLSLLPPPPSSIISADNSLSNSNTTEPVSEKANVCCDFNETEALSTTLKNLNDVLESKSDDDHLKEKLVDIRKRLDIVEKMWKENKFDKAIQVKLLQLSQAIKFGESDKADHLQKSLMVDHAALCSSWMAGIRHIIHSL